MRFALTALLALSLCACDLIFKLPTRQGNVLDQKDLDKVELGMSRAQVQFILGTPIAASPLRPDRWDYVAFYKNPRGAVFSRTVSMWFDADKLARIEGQKIADGSTAGVDLENAVKEEDKAKLEEERAKERTDSGVVIQQPKKK